MRLIQFIFFFVSLFRKKAKINALKIQELGLLAVKIGQMYAIRQDFLPPEKCKELSQLYQKTEPLSYKDFYQKVEQKCKSKLLKDIKKIAEKPLAAASVGQVHKATLKNDEEVIIKIIKEDYKKPFLRDIAVAKKIIKFIVFFYPKLKKLADPIGTIETIERQTLKELDLNNEIHGIKRLRQIKTSLAKKIKNFTKLDFPKYYSQYSNEEVYVCEYISGASFEQFIKDKKNYPRLLNLFEIQGAYLFLKGEFHGDLHPGNVFWHRNKIYFLDNSNVEKINANFSQNLGLMIFNLAKKQYGKAAETLHNISLKKIPTQKFQQFKKKFESLYSDFYGKTSIEASITLQMMNTIKLAINAGMEFEEGAFSIIKSLMYLDGMVMSCDPNRVLLDDLLPFEKVLT